MKFESMVCFYRTMPVKVIFLKIEDCRRLERIGRQFGSFHLKTADLYDSKRKTSSRFKTAEHDFAEGKSVIPARNSVERIGYKFHHRTLAFASRHRKHSAAHCAKTLRPNLKLGDNTHTCSPCGRLPRMVKRYSGTRHAKFPVAAFRPGIVAVQHAYAIAGASEQFCGSLSAPAVTKDYRVHCSRIRPNAIP